jgi:hypothetical protein
MKFYSASLDDPEGRAMQERMDLLLVELLMQPNGAVDDPGQAIEIVLDMARYECPDYGDDLTIDDP